MRLAHRVWQKLLRIITVQVDMKKPKLMRSQLVQLLETIVGKEMAEGCS